MLLTGAKEHTLPLGESIGIKQLLETAAAFLCRGFAGDCPGQRKSSSTEPTEVSPRAGTSRLRWSKEMSFIELISDQKRLNRTTDQI